MKGTKKHNILRPIGLFRPVIKFTKSSEVDHRLKFNKAKQVRTTFYQLDLCKYSTFD